MYHNIGRKFKLYAKIYAIIGVVLCLLSGIGIIIAGIVMGDSLIIIITIVGGLIIALLGSLLTWVSSWHIYWYGEMSEKIIEIEKNTRIR